MGYSHLFALQEGQIGGAGRAVCGVMTSHDFPLLSPQGAVVRLASGQFHHMLVRLLLISRLLVQALTHLWFTRWLVLRFPRRLVG
jgi:hypothetical protein